MNLLVGQTIEEITQAFVAEMGDEVLELNDFGEDTVADLAVGLAARRRLIALLDGHSKPVNEAEEALLKEATYDMSLTGLEGNLTLSRRIPDDGERLALWQIHDGHDFVVEVPTAQAAFDWMIKNLRN